MPGLATESGQAPSISTTEGVVALTARSGRVAAVYQRRVGALLGTDMQTTVDSWFLTGTDGLPPSGDQTPEQEIAVPNPAGWTEFQDSLLSAFDSRGRLLIGVSRSGPPPAAPAAAGSPPATMAQVMRFVPSGSSYVLDTSFGSGGVWTRTNTSPSTVALVWGLTVDSQDRPVVSLCLETGPTILRLTGAGAPDPSFGVAGFAGYLYLGKASNDAHVTVDAQDRPYMAGSLGAVPPTPTVPTFTADLHRSAAPPRFAPSAGGVAQSGPVTVARLTSGGILDPTFGAGNARTGSKPTAKLPASPPRHLTARFIAAKTLKVAWRAPASPGSSPRVLRYRVTYRSGHHRAVGFSTRHRSATHRITPPRRHETARVTVTAVTAVGVGRPTTTKVKRLR